MRDADEKLVEGRLYDRRQVQIWISCGQSTFWKLIRNGDLKALRIGGKLVVTGAELIQFISSRPPAREVPDEQAA